MNASRKTTLALLLAGLFMALGATSALASPAGDEDSPAFTSDGAAFNVIDSQTYSVRSRAMPLTIQDPGSKDVLVAGGLVTEAHGGIRIARFLPNGEPADFGTDGAVDIGLPNPVFVDRLLDLQVVGDTIYVLYRDSDGQLRWVTASSDGTTTNTGGPVDPENGVGTCEDVQTARVRDNGEFAAIWGCSKEVADPDNLQAQATQRFVRFEDYAPPPDGTGFRSGGDINTVTSAIDLELGPAGDAYGLFESDSGSTVIRFNVSGGNITLDSNYGQFGGFSRTIGDVPIDLAVDSSDRALVWTAPPSMLAATATPWYIHRLKPANGGDDTTWGTNGLVKLTDDRLGDPFDADLPMLLTRPDGKVLAYGVNCHRCSPLIVRLNGNGAVDTSWAAGGYKLIDFDGSKSFGFGSIARQSDLKTLIAFVGDDIRTVEARRSFGAPPEGQILGAGRLKEGVPASKPKPSNPSSPDQGGVAGTSAKGSVCGRRAISLVRAFSRGGRVELQGLVGAAYYGKKVTLYASSGHGFHKVRTTKATSRGTFSAKVRRPRGRKLITTRYIAKAGRSRSPVLKLPQSLKSTSIRERGGRITVKGHIKRALVGSRRNRVRIQRLVCGHYKTVGSARPSRSGRYTVTFDTPVLGGVAYFRARGVVLNKPGGHYVVQYARAIRIRRSAQTG